MKFFKKKSKKNIGLHLLMISLLCPQIILANETTVDNVTDSSRQTVASGDTLNITNNIQVSDNNSQGVTLNDQSNLNVGQDIIVSGTPNTWNNDQKVIGVNALDTATITVNNIKVSNTGNTGISSTAADITVNDSIIISGTRNNGIQAEGGTITVNGAIDPVSNKNIAIKIDNSLDSNGVKGKDTTVNINGNIVIKTDINGNHSLGVYIDGGKAILKGDIDISNTVSNDAQVGILAENGDIDAKGNIIINGYGYGINIKNGNLNFEGNISTTNIANTGIFAYSELNKNQTTTANIKSDITVSGPYSNGITITGADVEYTGNIKVNGSNDSKGIWLNGGNITSTGNITVEGSSSYGLHIFANHNMDTSATINGDIIVAKEGTSSTGLFTYFDPQLKTSVTVNGDIYANAESSKGLLVSNGHVTVNGSITSANLNSQAAQNNKGSLTITKDVLITANDESGENQSYGIIHFNEGTTSSVLGDVKATGENAVGACIFGGTYNVEGTTYVTGAGSYGVYLSNYYDVLGTANLNNLIVSGEGAIGAYTVDNSITNITGNLTVSGNAIGIYTSNTPGYTTTSAVANVTGSTISLSGEDSSGFVIVNDSTINIKDSTSTVQNSAILLTAANSGKFNLEKSNLQGNISHTALDDGILTITLKDSSSLTSAINVTDAANKINSKVDLTLTDATDTWNITADSVTNGKLTNNGKINFMSQGDFKTAIVKEYSAGSNAQLYLNVDISTEKSDKFIIDGKVTGKTDVFIQGTASSKPKDRINTSLIVANNWDTNGSDAEFQGYYEAGGYKYILENESVSGFAGNTQEWFLAYDGLASSGQTLALGSIIVPEIWYLETDTLINRLQNYSNKNYNGGFWMAAGSKKISHSDPGSYNSFDQTLYTTSLGWDNKKIRTNGNWFTGIMFGYGKDNRDNINGIGDNDMNSFQTSIYTINQRNNGFYFGGLVKYNRYSSDISAKIHNSYEKLNGHLNQDGLGTSLIAGKRFEKNNGWYFEPVAQLSYLTMYSDSYTSNSGSHIKVNDGNSFRARAGFSYGRKKILTNGSELDVYIDASLIHEFDGKTDVIIDDTKLTSDFSGTWGSYGIGTNLKLKNGNYLNARVYYSDGNSRREPWGANISFGFKF